VACLVVLSGLSTGCSEDTSSGSAVDVDRLVSLAAEQIAAGDPAAASEALLVALEADAEDVSVLYNLGLAAQNQGQDEAASDWYARALEVDPAHVPSLYNSAILLEGVDLEAAVDRYREVVGLDPTAANAHMRLGFALRHLGREEEAASFLQEGIRLDPSMRDIEAPRYD